MRRVAGAPAGPRCPASPAAVGRRRAGRVLELPALGVGRRDDAASARAAAARAALAAGVQALVLESERAARGDLLRATPGRRVARGGARAPRPHGLRLPCGVTHGPPSPGRAARATLGVDPARAIVEAVEELSEGSPRGPRAALADRRAGVRRRGRPRAEPARSVCAARAPAPRRGPGDHDERGHLAHPQCPVRGIVGEEAALDAVHGAAPNSASATAAGTSAGAAPAGGDGEERATCAADKHYECGDPDDADPRGRPARARASRRAVPRHEQAVAPGTPRHPCASGS